MNFLEAKRIVTGFAGGPALPMLLAMSGTGEPMELYLKAAAATRGRDAKIRLLPFNTLQQALLAPAAGEEREVFLLCPWDLVAELDWRSGVPADRLDVSQALAQADAVLDRIRQRSHATIVYLPAPLPPAFADRATLASVSSMLSARALAAGARLLPAEAFSLPGYFTSGMPVSGKLLGDAAEAIIAAALETKREPAKLLITDLDNTLWRGVIAEDGLDGIHYRAEGAGYRHFVYQTYLLRLKREGVILAAVSRNSPEVALAPLRAGTMTVQESDFVTVVASYHAKSAQIRELARQLNLGLDAVVFVDDNPVELQEVSQELPAVRCVTFPKQDDGVVALFEALSGHLARRDITAEDRERTEMYRRRLEGMVPSEVAGADLHGFLSDLRMRLTLHDRSSGDRTRAVQLINKTNQFNANGRRVTDEEVGVILAAGGRLLTATLEDRTGSHGEILAMLVTADGVVQAFVLSCRVFQRRVEQAFCAWLAEQPQPPASMLYAPTERNEPFQVFLKDPAFGVAAEGLVRWEAAAYAAAHADDLSLFELVTPVQA
jgi:FkbH-like protein